MSRPPPDERKRTLLGAVRARPVLLPMVASIAYVAAVALRAAGGRGALPWVMATVGLALAFRAERRPDKLGKTMGWGVALACASAGAVDGDGPSIFFASLAQAVTAGAATVAIERIPAAEGLLAGLAGPAVHPGPIGRLGRRRPWESWRLVALGVVWLPALTVRLIDAARVRPTASAAASLGSTSLLTACVLGVAFVVAGVRRGIELGVGTRVRTGLSLLGLSGALALGGLLTDVLGESEAYLLASIAGAGLAYRVALHRDPAALARRARRATVIAVGGGGVAIVGAMLGHGRVDAGAVALVTGLVGATLGSMALAIEAPLRPMQGLWLDAVDAASVALHKTDAETALEAVLGALRTPAGPTGPSPELWFLHPPRVITVDAAGYARHRDGVLPKGLLELASAEPEATLRREVLEAMEIRRQALRPYARWMADRGAMTATVVTRAGSAEGLLVLPHGPRTEALSLEEARALKALADELAAACEAGAALSRSLAREQELRDELEAMDEARRRLRHDYERERGRHAELAARLARPATVTSYSAPFRFAFDALARRVASLAPVVVVAPSGVDGTSQLARAHRDGPRREGPFVIVDGTSSVDRDPSVWSDPRKSPLALAHEGMLALVDGAALPLPIQDLLAEALSTRRFPWETADVLDVQLALVVTSAPRALLGAGRLSPRLALRLGDAADDPISLPRLRDRPEDLPALLVDRLGREGLRVKGQPIGIDPRALARLVEYPFDGELAELDAFVIRLVARCEGLQVRVGDVEALRLPCEDAPPAPSAGSRAV